MASLTLVHHSVTPFNSVSGCPILVNSATPVSCSSTASTGVFSVAAGSDMTGNPYNFSPRYPLLMKMFFTNVVMDGTVAYPNPEFIVNVSGPTPFKCHRIDEKNFGISLWIKQWDTKSLDTTVSITPISPLTGVTMDCLTGLATDTQDKSEEI